MPSFIVCTYKEINGWMDRYIEGGRGRDFVVPFPSSNNPLSPLSFGSIYRKIKWRRYLILTLKLFICQIGSAPGFEDGEFESAKLARPAASFYHADEDCLYFVDSEVCILNFLNYELWTICYILSWFLVIFFFCWTGWFFNYCIDSWVKRNSFLFSKHTHSSAYPVIQLWFCIASMEVFSLEAEVTLLPILNSYALALLIMIWIGCLRFLFSLQQ